MDIKIEPEDVFEAVSQDKTPWQNFNKAFVKSEVSIKTEPNDSEGCISMENCSQDTYVELKRLKIETDAISEEAKLEMKREVKLIDHSLVGHENFPFDGKPFISEKNAPSSRSGVTPKQEKVFEVAIENNDFKKVAEDPETINATCPYDAQKFVCNVCFEVFLTAAEQNLHKAIHVQSACQFEKSDINDRPAVKRRKRYSCKKCLFISTIIGEFRSHLRTHLEKKTFACEECELIFKSVKNLKRHKMIHSGKKPYKCDRCDFSCISSTDLKFHKLTHAGKKPYTCDECDYSCAYLCYMKKHKTIHTGVKPLKCDHCDYTTKRADKLKVHTVRHTGEKYLKCDQCDYSCARSKSMKLHKFAHTGEKPFKCDRCSYACVRMTTLRSHQIVHSEEKPFKCDECDYTSRRLNHIKLHKITHTREKPFKCDKCHQAFTRLGSLKRHKMVETCKYFQTSVELEIETNAICEEKTSEVKDQNEVVDPSPLPVDLGEFSSNDRGLISEQVTSTSRVNCSDVPPKQEHIFEIKIENNDIKKEDEDESVKTSFSFGCSEDCGSGVDSPPPGLVAQIILHRVPAYSRSFVCNVCFEIFPSAAEQNLHRIIHMPRNMSVREE